MKEILAKFMKYKYVYGILLVIFIVDIFLRTYHSITWLHFELDQARDIFVVYDMLHNGVLPLLGPYARGSELYLGPIFYYFQAFPAILFGVTPFVVTLPDLLASILFVPLMYVFARLYFTRSISLMLAAVTATSIFLITYGRFAWNPNSLPFWITLAMYSLIQSWRYKKFNGKWFLMMVGATAVAMQLHFVAFLTLPLIIIIYAIIVRIHPSWKIVAWAVVLFGVLYLPVIISEVDTGGANTKAFFTTITDKGNKDEKHNIVEKVFRSAQETSTYNFVLLSGVQSGGDNIRTKKTSSGYFLCDKECRQRLSVHLVAIITLVVMIAFFAYQIYKKWKNRNINNELYYEYQKYLLVTLWLCFGGIFLILMAYQISPRFYLFIVPALYIVFGNILTLIEKKFSTIGIYIVRIIVICLIVLNLINIVQYFSVLNMAGEVDAKIEWRDLIMKRADYITLEQLQDASKYIAQQDDEEFIIIGDNRYARALYFLTVIEQNIDGVLCYIKRSSFEENQIEGMNYYLLTRTKSKKQIVDEMVQGHEIVEQKQYGTLTLYRMKANNHESNDQIPKGCFIR
jgi:hypothetical protein